MNSIITKQNLTQEIERGEKEIERGTDGGKQGKNGEEKGKKIGREGKGKWRELEQTLTLFYTPGKDLLLKQKLVHALPLLTTHMLVYKPYKGMTLKHVLLLLRVLDK
jgi:hypothetical protein